MNNLDVPFQFYEKITFLNAILPCKWVIKPQTIKLSTKKDNKKVIFINK